MHVEEGAAAHSCRLCQRFAARSESNPQQSSKGSKSASSPGRRKDAPQGNHMEQCPKAQALGLLLGNAYILKGCNASSH
eukprot:1151965-Pelagomonas_calceolata.AAC.2